MKKLILISIILSSCSVQFHERKFYQKGGKFNCVPEVIQRTDTIQGVDGDDSIVYCYDTIWKPETEYVTKWQYKFNNKRFNDSLAHIRKLYESVTEAEEKQAKIEYRTKRIEAKPTFRGVLISLVIGFVIGGLVVYKLKRR